MMNLKKTLSECFENPNEAYEAIINKMKTNSISLPFMIYKIGIDDWQYALESSKDKPLVEL